MSDIIKKASDTAKDICANEVILQEYSTTNLPEANIKVPKMFEMVRIIPSLQFAITFFNPILNCYQLMKDGKKPL